MRRLPLVLALSLIANASLGVVLWQRAAARSSSLSSDHTPAPLSTSDKTTRPTDTERWQQISTLPDDTAYIAALRAAGFPPEVIAALTRERVTARYASRLRELKKQNPAKPYWQSDWYDHDFNYGNYSAQRALYREIEDTLRSLLGPDALILSRHQRQDRERRFGPIASARISELEAIERDYSDIGLQLREQTKGVMLASDRERLAYLEREKRADLERILSPDELAEYDRRNSPSAVEIRNKFYNFDGTEDEFLKLHALQRDFDARHGRDNLTGEQKDRRTAALPELAKQFEAALGPERYAEYVETTDGNFRSTSAAVAEMKLPPEKTRELIRIQRDANQRADRIRKSNTPAAERSSELTALQKEATEKIRASLGSAENVTTYERWSGQWISRLNPPAKTAR